MRRSWSRKTNGPGPSSFTGTIFFHNYCVRSDWGDGEKDVVVPAGTTVVFTAFKNGEPAPSDWTVDGILVETNKTSYTFNAPVSEPRFLSVRPLSSPYEGLKSESYVANDSTESALEDSGSAQESGIIRISGPNSKFSEQTAESPGRTASSLNRRKGVQRGRRAKSFTRSLVHNSF